MNHNGNIIIIVCKIQYLFLINAYALALALASVMAVSLVACGSTNADTNADKHRYLRKKEALLLLHSCLRYRSHT